MSSYKIFWTKEALVSFELNNDYLHFVWGEKALNSFLNDISLSIQEIKNNPEHFSFYNKEKNVRRCVVNKRITLYFKIINETRIDIISFWNNWKDPKNLPF